MQCEHYISNFVSTHCHETNQAILIATCAPQIDLDTNVTLMIICNDHYQE